MNDTQRKFFLYVRKSTDDADRQVRSIADQLAEARELAERDGVVIADTYIEKETAKKPGRPVFNKMMERIEQGEASGIIAWHPDRLARNSLDGGRIIWLVDTGAIKELLFPSFRFDPTPQGKLSLAIEFGISKYYVDKLSEDIRRGIRQKLKNGIWPQQAPVGYLNDHKTKTIVVDPVKAPLIRKAYEMYATGEYTLRQVRVAVNSLGFSGKHSGVLSTSNYQYILQNPVYYGLIRYHGEYYEGKHEPIISKALFECAQAVMANKSKLKSDKRKPYLYRGLFHCGECGRLITTETQKGHNYLRCTKWEVRCSQPYVREERVEEEITDAVRSFALPTEWTDWMLGQAHALEAAEADEAKGQIETLRDRLQAAGEQLDRLMTAYTHGVLSLSEYRDAKNKLVAERRQAEEQLIAIERNRSSAFEPLKTFLNATKQAGMLADTGTNEQKRDFLKNATSNLTISDRHLSVVPREAWELVVNQGRLAQHNAAPFFRDAAFAGETDHNFQQRRGRDSNPGYGFDPV
jgi:site-specific DNA recombinase